MSRQPEAVIPVVRRIKDKMTFPLTTLKVKTIERSRDFAPAQRGYLAGHASLQLERVLLPGPVLP